MAYLGGVVMESRGWNRQKPIGAGGGASTPTQAEPPVRWRESATVSAGGRGRKAEAEKAAGREGRPEADGEKEQRGDRWQSGN